MNVCQQGHRIESNGFVQREQTSYQLSQLHHGAPDLFHQHLLAIVVFVRVGSEEKAGVRNIHGEDGERDHPAV
jgi:hypothetical protein